jgi:hypothetical protein
MTLVLRKRLTNPPRVENNVIPSLCHKCIVLIYANSPDHSHESIFKEAPEPNMTFQSSEVQTRATGTTIVNLLLGINRMWKLQSRHVSPIGTRTIISRGGWVWYSSSKLTDFIAVSLDILALFLDSPPYQKSATTNEETELSNSLSLYVSKICTVTSGEERTREEIIDAILHKLHSMMIHWRGKIVLPLKPKRSMIPTSFTALLRKSALTLDWLQTREKPWS